MRLHVNVVMNVNGARQPRSTAGKRKSPEPLSETKYFYFSKHKLIHIMYSLRI